VARDKVPDPNKRIQSTYVRVKNGIETGPIPLRRWVKLVPTEKPRSYQRTGKDTGVI